MKNKKWTVKITVKQQLISATQQINPANDKDTAIIKSSSHTHKKKKIHICLPKPIEGRQKFRIQAK